jgi:hypothetical protein
VNETILAVTACLFLVATACASHHAKPTAGEDQSASLLVLSEAEGVAFSEPNSLGEISVSYQVRAAFPALEATEAIKSHVASLGFSERSESIVDPGKPLSNGENWEHFGDIRTGSPYCVQQWWGEWENDGGNVVIYVLQYRSPGGEPRTSCDRLPRNSDLLVSATAVTPAGVEWRAETIRALESGDDPP